MSKSTAPQTNTEKNKSNGGHGMPCPYELDDEIGVSGVLRGTETADRIMQFNK